MSEQGQGFLGLRLLLHRLRAPGPGGIFRKAIDWRWRAGLGVAAFVFLAAAYTYLSWSRQREDPSDMLLPNWSQLWRKGVVQNLNPVEVVPRPPTAQEKAKHEAREERLKAADPRLREHFIKDDDERLKEEVARLQALAGPLTEKQLEAETDRLQILPQLPLDQRDQAEEDLKVALSRLSESERPKAIEGLKKVEEALKKVQEADAARISWRLNFSQVNLLWDVLATVTRLVSGLAMALVISIVLGILMGCYSPIEAFLYPPLAILAKIPGTAMMSLFLVIAALNEFWFAQYMILFGMIPTLTQTMYYYTKDIPEELLFKARTLGASQAECIWSVIFQQILPKIMESLRLSVGPALIFLFAAEYVLGDVGLGCRMRLVIHKSVTESPTVYFYIACVALLFFAIESSLRGLERKLFPWYYPE
jgi:NitT/TauT family transport system permease protein